MYVYTCTRTNIYNNPELFDRISIKAVIFIVFNGMNIRQNNTVVQLVHKAVVWCG